MSEGKSGFSAIDESQDFPSEPDSETNSESEDLARAAKKVDIEGRKQDIKERKAYADRIFWLVVAWLVFVGYILIAHGARWPWMAQYLGFNLPEAVLIALITTTTGGVVGILLIVVQYLFPRRSKKVD